jgi:serine/threonine protein kinase
VLERVEVEEPEEEEEEEEEEKPLIATGGLAVGDVRVGKRIGGGSFGTVFEGSWRGEAIILKCANTRVEGAALLLEQEMQINEIAMERAPDTCADYIGALEVSAAQSGAIYQGFLTQGLWLVWSMQSLETLWYYLSRRGSTPAMAAALGLDTTERVGPQLEAAVTRRVMVETLTALDAMHAAGLVHCDVKPQNMLITENGIRLIDLGGGASCIYPPLINYAPGEGVHDPLYSPPEANLLPENSKPPTLRNARGLWKEHQPQLFDLYSVGVVLMQLALPRLRNDAALKTFRQQLEALDGDLAAWRAAKGSAADDAVLGQRGGWELAAGLLRVQRLGGKGKDALPGRMTCAEALEHPFLAEEENDSENDES